MFGRKVLPGIAAALFALTVTSMRASNLESLDFSQVGVLGGGDAAAVGSNVVSTPRTLEPGVLVLIGLGLIGAASGLRRTKALGGRLSSSPRRIPPFLGRMLLLAIRAECGSAAKKSSVDLSGSN
jgi:hypothetical protein